MELTLEDKLGFVGVMLGSDVTARDARLLSAIPDGQDFDVILPDSASNSAHYIITTIPGADYWSMKGIAWRGWDQRPLMIGYSAGRPKSLTGRGEGARLFYRQVMAAVRYDIPRILTTGAGQHGSWMNGYYTWPRLGYDGRIGDGPWRKMPPELRDVCGEDRSVLKLCRHPFGRVWWRENGKTIDLFFDSRPGSESLAVLEEYVKERGLVDGSV